MERALGARESGELRYIVAVKLWAKKVDWRLSKRVIYILCIVYIEASIKSVSIIGRVEDNVRSRYYICSTLTSILPT